MGVNSCKRCHRSNAGNWLFSWSFFFLAIKYFKFEIRVQSKITAKKQDQNLLLRIYNIIILLYYILTIRSYTLIIRRRRSYDHKTKQKSNNYLSHRIHIYKKPMFVPQYILTHNARWIRLPRLVSRRAKRNTMLLPHTAALDTLRANPLIAARLHNILTCYRHYKILIKLCKYRFRLISIYTNI